MNIADPNDQTVGQSLTLQCSGTTVRGIISEVDIVWRNGSMVLNRTNIMLNDQLMYTDSYNIQTLTTDHNDSVIQCEVVINASTPVMASDSVTLNVNGKLVYIYAKQKHPGVKSARPIRSSPTYV